MLTLNEQNYKEILKSGTFVIDIWQENCGDCDAYGPLFRAAEKILDTDVKFAGFKVLRESSEFRREFLTFDKGEKAASPTTVLVKDGKMVKRVTGYISLFDLNNFIAKEGDEKKLSDYSKTELQAMAFRKIQEVQMYDALAKDSQQFISKIDQEIEKKEG